MQVQLFSLFRKKIKQQMKPKSTTPLHFKQEKHSDSSVRACGVGQIERERVINIGYKVKD